MKSIVTVPNSVLSAPADAVISFDGKLRKLVTDLETTLRSTVNPKGVGLAAPQIGVGLRVFVTRPTEKSKIRAFINPEITKKSDSVTYEVPDTHDKSEDKSGSHPNEAGKLEGCLSIPAVWGNVKRSVSLTLKYQDIDGVSHEEKFTGFIATIIQHETDHINGILFTQRVLEQKQKLYEAITDENGKDVLDEIKI